ncbi:MAG TPA: ABC transporter permease [Myxococcota bacterium]|nr:ABC transporter permease [Myxococcota bacterium]
MTIRTLYGALCAVVLFLLVVPVFVIVPLSFSSASFLQFPPPSLSLRWYREYFGRADWMHATLLSLEVAAAVALVATPLGTLAAFGFVRGAVRRRQLLQAFVVSPMIVPVIVIATALYFTFAKLRLVGSIWGLIAAHSVLAIPKVFLVITATLRGIDPAYERAALSLGASRFWAFVLVTLPLVRTGVAVAAGLAFLTSFDEVVVAIFISGSTAVTLPKRMWDGIRLEYDPTITAVSSLLIALTIVGVILLGRPGITRQTGEGAAAGKPRVSDT